MMAMYNVKWDEILTTIAADISIEFELDIIVESYILKEIQMRVDATLANLHMEKPNVAKIAGVVAFWVRKLKPFCYAYSEIAKSGKLSTLNELIAIQAGLAICRQCYDDYSAEEFQPLSKRLLNDWLHSLRFHSHSPHSSMFAFELLTTKNVDGSASL
jgi:hypothetical protein